MAEDAAGVCGAGKGTAEVYGLLAVPRLRKWDETPFFLSLPCPHIKALLLLITLKYSRSAQCDGFLCPPLTMLLLRTPESS